MPDGDRDAPKWYDSIAIFIVVGMYVLFGVGILGGIGLLIWYNFLALLQIIIVIIVVMVAIGLLGKLGDFVNYFPVSVETWPNWLRWLSLIPLVVISIIFPVFVFFFLINYVKTTFNISGLFWLLFVTIVVAFCAFLSGAVFIVSGTGIAPRFRIAVATSLSLIAVGVDFVLTSGVGASPYSLVIAGALVVGVIAGWKYAGDDGFFN
jgi:hypothetical protein